MIFRLFRRAPQDEHRAHSMARSWHRRGLRRFTGAMGSQTRSTDDSRWSCSMPFCFCGVWRVRRPRPRAGPGVYSTGSARTWTTACAKWAWAILRFREKCDAIGEAFYGRQRAYGAALAVADGEPLAAVLERNVFAGAAERRARQTVGDLCACRLRPHAEQAVDSLQRGELRFPIREQSRSRT